MFDDTMCTAYAVLGSLFGFVSILTMTMISIERFLVIKNPFTVFNTNNKFSICLIMFTWLYGSFWSIVPIFTPNNYVPEGFLTSCTFDYLDQSTNSFIAIMLMNLCGFVVPLVTTSLFYILISVHIKSHYSYLKKYYDYGLTNSFRSNSVDTRLTKTNDEMITEKNTKFNQKKKAKAKATRLSAELRLLRSSVITVLMFCLAWSPYAIISLLAQYSPNRSEYVTPSTVMLPTLFAKTSAVTNPILYAFTNQDFINRLKKKFKCT
jgi:r-opsin